MIRSEVSLSLVEGSGAFEHAASVAAKLMRIAYLMFKGYSRCVAVVSRLRRDAGKALDSLEGHG